MRHGTEDTISVGVIRVDLTTVLRNRCQCGKSPSFYVLKASVISHLTKAQIRQKISK